MDLYPAAPVDSPLRMHGGSPPSPWVVTEMGYLQSVKSKTRKCPHSKASYGHDCLYTLTWALLPAYIDMSG